MLRPDRRVQLQLESTAAKSLEIQPIAGLKRMFGARSLVELAKAIAKFALVGGVAYILITSSISDFSEISRMAFEPGISASASLVTTHFSWRRQRSLSLP